MRKSGALTLTLGLWLLAGLAWAGTAPKKIQAASQEEAFTLPPYPRSSPVQMGARLQANDVPLEAAVFSTPDPLATVFAFYRKQIRARKKQLVEHWFDPRSGYIGFFEPTSSTMRLVNAMALEGSTLLVFSAMNPEPLLTAAPKIPAGLPTVPGARDVVTTQAIEKRGQDRTITFRVPGSPPAQVLKQLLESAAQLGWKPGDGEFPATSALRVLRRGDEVCVLRTEEAPGAASEAPSTAVAMVIATSALSESAEATR